MTKPRKIIPYNTPSDDNHTPNIVTPYGFIVPGVGRTPEVRSRDASTLSAISNTVGSFLPPPIGNIISIVGSIPDIGEDIISFYKNPSYNNAGHLLLDGVNRVTRATRTKYDDIIGAAGIVDDALQGQGINIFDWANQVITPVKSLLRGLGIQNRVAQQIDNKNYPLQLQIKKN